MPVGGRVAGVVCEQASPNIKAEKIRLRVEEEKTPKPDRFVLGVQGRKSGGGPE